MRTRANVTMLLLLVFVLPFVVPVFVHADSERPLDRDRLAWVEDGDSFGAMFKESLTDDRPLQYLAEGKFLSFKPVGAMSAKKTLGTRTAYEDALGEGISIEMELSRDHWRKLIRIDSLEALGQLGGKQTVDFTFEVESDFDIPVGENKKPRIRLGDNSYIEVAQAWDSMPEVFDRKTGKGYQNKIPIKSYFVEGGGTLYFVKKIPVKWLKTAMFPVWCDTDISWGTASEFEAGLTKYCQCCEIDDGKFVVVFEDNSDAGAGKARVGTVNGNDVITWGAVSEFCSAVDVGESLGVCKLDTDDFVVVYADDDQADDGYARVGVVTDVTIAWGAALEFENGDIYYPSCCQLGTDKFGILYNDVTGGNVGSVCVCTVAGNVITAGAGVGFESQISYCDCCKLDTDKFLTFYADSGDGNKAKACVITVVGLVPTANAIKVIADADVSSWEQCTQLETDKAVVAWTEWVANDESYIEVCTIAGAAITEGAAVELDYGAWLGLATVNTTRVAMVYENRDNGNRGTSIVATVSGTTITAGTPEIFSDADVEYCDICVVDTGVMVAVYQDDADVGDIGEAVAGHEPFLDSPWNLQAYPTGDTVSLAWVKGSNQNMTMLRREADEYPTGVADGTLIYYGLSSSVLDDNVTIGVNYYYRAWGEITGNYSAAYADAVATTFAAGAGADTPDAPDTPTGWWVATDYTGLDEWFFYPIMNDFADVYGVPRNTFWFLAVLLFIMSIGLIIFSVSHEPTVSIIAVGIMIVTASASELLPLWIVAAYCVPVASIFFVRTRI